MSPRGDIRPRADCPRCGRSTAVTFNSRTGAAYLRSHVAEPLIPCTGSRLEVPRSGVR